ncbi:MAG: alpha/beta fold hydrolase [Ferruginibacter sp.]|nr:alpha/beta fold hydrolase [Ferruginibacter sp.]
MQAIKNILLPGTRNRPMALDIFFNDHRYRKPVVVYVHGFNGFKDWGNFDIIASKFANEGYVLVKFNFSHNGTTPAQPEDFTDLEAFGNNNYTKQLDDLRLIINWVCQPLNPYRQAIDSNHICLVGHSMGGGIAILQAAEDSRVTKLITWAGISECTTPWGNWPPDKMQEWKQLGVQYYTNGRTHQQMPLYYQLYEDYIQNTNRLNIKKAIKSLAIPILVCHGTMDEAVPVEKAGELKEWQPSAQIFTVESDHVFGRKHPWTTDDLPPAMQAVVEASLRFLKSGNADN